MNNKLFKITALAMLGGSLIAASTMGIAGIATTKHNLAGGGTGTGANKFSGTAEICVFCHTPHGAATGVKAPLWNKTLPATSYTTYDSLGTSSLDGATTTNVGSVSVACLSCHDGTQAMDVVINAPGSGLATAAYTAGSWTGNANPQGVANLTADLSNDHPVGIQYAGGGLDSGDASDAVYTNTAFTDKDFKSVYKKTINTKPIWWVDSNADTVREKTEMQLYTRPSTDLAGGGATSEPFVECASCHDPHSNNTTFLRIENTGSAVCLACHDK